MTVLLLQVAAYLNVNELGGNAGGNLRHYQHMRSRKWVRLKDFSQIGLKWN